MSIITRTTQHGILAVNLLWEQHTVSVERKESILTLEEFLEIESIGYADSWSVITVTPCNPVAVFNPSDTRVVLVFRLYHISISRLELNRFMINFPVYTILTETCKNIHLDSFVITTENSCKSIPKRNNSTIEYTVRSRNMISSDNRIL